MFQPLRNIAKILFPGDKRKASGGQIAIILILVIAAALIFYAVSLNLGQFAVSRAIVTIASNSGASMLASNMASYGQMLSSTSLKDKDELCRWSGIAAAVLAVIIALVALAVMGPAGVAAGYVLLAKIGIALAVVGVVLEATVIQPGLTSSWNRVIGETLSMSNQFTEGAIQTALQKAVTDSVEVPDVTDSDGDRIWSTSEDLANEPYADMVSRFGLYYNERLRQIKKAVPMPEVVKFIEDLTEFLYEGSDGWGLFDPIQSCRGYAECTACCLPETFMGESVRPEECEPSPAEGSWEELCGLASPYQTGYPWIFDPAFENHNNDFFSFRELIGRDDEHRKFYKSETDPNSVPIGGGRISQMLHVSGEEGFHLEDTSGFYVPPHYPEYDPMVNPPTGENRKGIFPLFYKLADWGVDLSKVPGNLESAAGSAGTLRECHWGHYDEDDPDSAPECEGLSPHEHPKEIRQLILPMSPDNPDLKYNTSYFVDGIGNPLDAADPSKPPLAVDKVSIGLPGPLIAESFGGQATDQCAEKAIYPNINWDIGIWRRGGDQFCSAEFPYQFGCTKCPNENDPDCQCDIPSTDPAEPSNFPDDPIDNLVYHTTFFIELAERLISDAYGSLAGISKVEGSEDLDKALAAFSEDFFNWYPEIAVWIEPGTPPGEMSTSSDTPCYLCGDLRMSDDGPPLRKGYLYVFLDTMIQLRDRLQGWLDNNVPGQGPKGYTGKTCNEVWCVPDPALRSSSTPCVEIPSGEGEEATFNTNMTFDPATDVQGDVIDIVGCLNYNVNGYDHVAAEKFKHCLSTRNGTDCRPYAAVTGTGALPRYHLDGVTPYEYPEDTSFTPDSWGPGNAWFEAITRNVALAVNPPSINEGNAVRFERCADTCSLADCHRLPRSLVRFTPEPSDPTMYFPNGCPDDAPDYCVSYTPWSAGAAMDATTADATWRDLTAFHDCLRHCNEQNCTVGPRLPSGPGYSYSAEFRSCGGGWGTYGAGNDWYDEIVDNINAITPEGEKDLPAMRNCFWDCSGSIADCRLMSNDPIYAVNWPGDPAAFDAANCAGWIAGNEWYEAIIENIIVAGGPACDVNPDTNVTVGNPSQWLANTGQSALEAVNQVAKFEKRRDFLDNRVKEVKKVLEILDGGVFCKPDNPGEHMCNRARTCSQDEADNGTDPGAIDKFTDFLCGPAADLIKARIDPPDEQEKGLPFQAIYGWRDAPDPEESIDDAVDKAKWHIVKVEARIPTMCDDACGVGLTSPDPEWPRITTKTKALGMRRCYTLKNKEGSVKFRVTRWDEDKTSSPILFPSGVPIWRFRSNNPERPLDPIGKSADHGAHLLGLDRYCGHLALPAPAGASPEVKANYEGAFIMNQYVSSYDETYDIPENSRCWRLANGLLSTGVVSETCAEYYWHGGQNRGMGLRFVPCDKPF